MQFGEDVIYMAKKFWNSGCNASQWDLLNEYYKKHINMLSFMIKAL